jgi:hypothetical protein
VRLASQLWFPRKPPSPPSQSGPPTAFTPEPVRHRVAGQTVFHAHVHLIPQRKGDVENPRGGVRHIIDGKGEY